MWFSVAGAVLGALIVHAWWLETYTDSPLARWWRRMSAAMSPTRNAQAMLRPCTGLRACSIVCVSVILFERIDA